MVAAASIGTAASSPGEAGAGRSAAPYTRPRGRAARGRGRRLARSTAIFALATGSRACSASSARSSRAYYFGAGGQDQRVHGRVPDAEPRSRARRRRRALLRVRPGLQRAAREGGAQARLAGRLDASSGSMLLGLGGLTALSSCSRRWIIAPVRRSRRRRGARRHALARSSSRSSCCSASPASIVGILNSYDHFTVPALTPVFWNLAIIAGPRPRRSARGHDRRQALRLRRSRSLVGTVIQVLLPLPWLRGLDGRLQHRDRLARPGGQAGVRR